MTTVTLPRSALKWTGQAIPIRARLLINGAAQVPTAARFSARIKGADLFEMTNTSGLTITAVTGWVSGTVSATITDTWKAGKEVRFHLEADYGSGYQTLDAGTWLMQYAPEHDT